MFLPPADTEQGFQFLVKIQGMEIFCCLFRFWLWRESQTLLTYGNNLQLLLGEANMFQSQKLDKPPPAGSGSASGSLPCGQEAS